MRIAKIEYQGYVMTAYGPSGTGAYGLEIWDAAGVVFDSPHALADTEWGFDDPDDLDDLEDDEDDQGPTVQWSSERWEAELREGAAEVLTYHGIYP